MTKRTITRLRSLRLIEKGAYFFRDSNTVILERLVTAVTEKSKLTGFVGSMLRMFKFDTLETSIQLVCEISGDVEQELHMDKSI